MISKEKCPCGCEGNNKDFIGKVWDKKCIYYLQKELIKKCKTKYNYNRIYKNMNIKPTKDRSKYWDELVDIIDIHFPKGKCKERGQALVALAYIDMLLKDNPLK